jgi:hypothetical protein
MKVRAFWDITPCIWFDKTDVSEVRTASIIKMMTEVVRTSEMSVYSNETTRLYSPEDSHLHSKLVYNRRVYADNYI